MRCVKVTGRRGQQVIRTGVVAQPQLGGPAAYGRGLAAAFGAGEPAAAYGFWDRPAAAQRLPAAVQLLAAQQTGPQPCAPGQNRNPTTGRCIKLTGRTYKKLYPRPPVPAVLQPRRELTEGPTRLPVGTAEPAPLGDPASTQAWIRDNCKNKQDPISGLAWVDADTTQLQEVIRLHQRTCTLATGLNESVKTQHRIGKPATIPGEADTGLTLDDFKALRTTMRRRDPAYKIPGRRHQPPPDTWKLYVASDNRSGSEYASVLIVDVAKARATPTGYEYPTESVKIDLGFIPTTSPPGTLCQPQMLVTLLDQLAKNNRLLDPVPGGWKPVFTPHGKSYWGSGAERAERVSRLCRELTRALTTPF